MYYSPVTVSKFYDLRLEGKTLHEIVAEIGISIATANRWNRLFKADFTKINNARLDSLKNKILSGYDEYFDFLHECFVRLKNQLNKFENVSPEYLNILKSFLYLFNAINRADLVRKYSDNSIYEEIAADDDGETATINEPLSNNEPVSKQPVFRGKPF